MEESVRCVFVANGQVEAEQVRSFLGSAGIESELRAETLSKTHALTVDGLGRVEVIVASGDEEQARAMLASAEAGDLELQEDSDPERLS